MDQYWQQQWAQQCALQVGVNYSAHAYNNYVYHDAHTIGAF